MARILAISSHVVSGHVGLSAIVPALVALGHDVLALPTVLLSNHPGGQRASGQRVDPFVLAGIVETLAANGRLADIDAVLTGYLPSAAHVGVARTAIEAATTPAGTPLFLCDPVIGDDPKGVYIDADAAEAIRDLLLPLAHIATPNRFELAWLTGLDINDVASAETAARRLAPALVVATSVPAPPDRLATLAVGRTTMATETVHRRPHAPHGTGDLLSALYLAAYLAERPAGADAAARALVRAVATVDLVLAASAGASELDLAPIIRGQQERTSIVRS